MEEKGKDFDEKVETTEQVTVVADEPKDAKACKCEGSCKTKNVAAITMSVIALVLGCGGLALGWMSYQKSSTPLTFLGSGADGNSANFVEGSIAEVAEKVSKSVVSIVTSTKSTNIFGQNSGAAGTGIIATEDGYIITNKHVVNGASRATVVLDDGTTYENVEVVATDPLNDVAYLKIKDASGLTPATLGDSKTISVGQQVIAIGNALGLYQNTVTAGIISGTGRSVTASDSNGGNTETLSDMIQTDAAINSGNSGGPLVNAAGEVIGINTAVSASAENMGFAIPISSAKGMLKQLIETGSAKRTYLGVYSVEITPEVAKAYNLPVNEGVYLYSPSSYSAIINGSPAAKAGLKDKDIITKINGVAVGASGSLANLVGEYKPGDTIQLTVIRDGNETAINVTLEGYPD
ncbi:trypsin-like peptidase domain-containing protein [Candidatus Saccharibacteria bacterium]|nr:trypsin-like peptidase domain-containing protein [Candidatus Saccharibacteria bacterium]